MAVLLPSPRCHPPQCLYCPTRRLCKCPPFPSRSHRSHPGSSPGANSPPTPPSRPPPARGPAAPPPPFCAAPSPPAGANWGCHRVPAPPVGWGRRGPALTAVTAPGARLPFPTHGSGGRREGFTRGPWGPPLPRPAVPAGRGKGALPGGAAEGRGGEGRVLRGWSRASLCV